MEAILFIGIQAVGKSTFYKARFFRTHMRINLDMLKTRYREALILQACLETQMSFVVDNTNLTRAERSQYIQKAKAHRFRVIGYYFQSKVQDALIRNQLRSEEERIPEMGILGAAGRLERPTYDEGFNALYYVSIADNGDFLVQEWQAE